jgi:hypothetical protein
MRGVVTLRILVAATSFSSSVLAVGASLIQRRAVPTQQAATGCQLWMFVIVFVIFIVPVALCVPATLVFIPPPVIGIPAMLASFSQVVTRVVSLRTSIPMVLDSLMQPVIGFCDSAMALFITIGAQIWSRAEHHKCNRCCCGKRRPSETMW